MAIEQQLYDTLKVLCPRTFPDFAPVATVRPYVTFQNVGGATLRFIGGEPADRRFTDMQINVWADSRLSAMTLARQIEDALCAATAFTARPNAEPVSDFDADIPVFGCRQDFTLFATR
ncbi:MAG: DUF3168 domain-containing protein [Polaromonas sp.]